MFTQAMECDYCEMTRELLLELAGLNDNITVDVYDFIEDEAQAQAYEIDKIPATVVMGDKDYGIRFYGVPAGYEFMSLIEDIVDVVVAICGGAACESGSAGADAGDGDTHVPLLPARCAYRAQVCDGFGVHHRRYG